MVYTINNKKAIYNWREKNKEKWQEMQKGYIKKYSQKKMECQCCKKIYNIVYYKKYHTLTKKHLENLKNMDKLTINFGNIN